MPKPENDPQTLDLQFAQQIDELCQSFESAWKRGDEPQVEAWLARVDADLRPHLQRALEAAKSSFEASTIELSDTRRVAAELQNAAPQSDAESISIPGYAISGKIAEGGMGRVYAARDL